MLPLRKINHSIIRPKKQINALYAINLLWKSNHTFNKSICLWDLTKILAIKRHQCNNNYIKGYE